MENVSYDNFYNASTGVYYNLPAGYKESLACTHDPSYATPAQTTYTGCNVPLQYYEYHTNPERWSNELRLSLQARRALPLARRPVLGEDPRQELRQHLLHAGAAVRRRRVPVLRLLRHARSTRCPRASGTPTPRARTTCRPPSSRTSASMSPTSSTSKPAWCISIPTSTTTAPTAVRLHARRPRASTTGSLAQVEQQVRHQLQDHRQGDGVCRSSPRASATAAPIPGIRSPATTTACRRATCPTRSTTTSSAGRRPASTAACCGTVRSTSWTGSSCRRFIYDVDICPPSSFNVNVGDARIYGVESNIDYKINDNWSLQAAGSYTDAHLISSPYGDLPGQCRRAAALRAVLQLQRQRALRALPRRASCAATRSSTSAHKGDMWNDLHVAGSNGFPRILQPEYSLMNLRFGLNPGGRSLAGGALRHQPHRQERDRLQQHRQLRPARRRPTSRASTACA